MKHKEVKLSVTINGQEITRNYKFALGEYEDKDWYGEMVDILDSYEEPVENMTADDYQDSNHIKVNNMSNKQTFEEYLQDIFMEEREIGGIPITKDNCEDMFDNWLSNLDAQEWLDYGDNFKNHE